MSLFFFAVRNRMGPTNNGKSDYIDLDGTPGEFIYSLIKL